MEVYGTFINLFLCIWSLFCIDISNTSEKGITKTVCAGDEATLFFRILYPSDVFQVNFVKNVEIQHKQTYYEIGTYSPEKGVFVDNQFKNRYSIIQEKSRIILKINDTKESDQGNFICRVVYDGKPDVTKEQHLIVKEKDNSSLITFKERNNSSCKIVTCSAESRTLNLKKPNNESITGSHNELNFCNYSLFINGGYSCCLVTSCSKEICKNLTLEWKYPMNSSNWSVVVIIGCLTPVIFVLFLGFFCIFREKKYRFKKISDAICCKKKEINESGIKLNEMRIVLIGKTGTGKSATANKIAGSDLFYSTANALNSTRKCKRKVFQRFDKKFVLVDTPGMFHNSISKKKLTTEIAKCIELAEPGPHAFLLVVNVGRFTKEDQETVNYFVDRFGKDFSKYLIVVFTRMDDLDNENTTLKEHVKNARNELKRILLLCEGRYVGFNNNLKGEENNGQVQILLEKIDSIIKTNNNKCYTNKMYKEAEKALKIQHNSNGVITLSEKIESDPLIR